MDFELTDEEVGTGGSLRLAALPPFLRVLLVTDGTVTRSLEAYFQEPIDVDVLVHAETDADRSYPEIEVVPGDPIIQRRVVLRGKVTRTAYAFAESIFAAGRVAPSLRRQLTSEKKGIGELLRDGRLESYREVLGMRRVAAGDWAGPLNLDRDSSVVIRDYRIYLAGRAAIEIEEVFPVARFQ